MPISSRPGADETRSLLHSRKAWWIVVTILVLAVIATAVSCRPFGNRRDWPRAEVNPPPPASGAPHDAKDDPS